MSTRFSSLSFTSGDYKIQNIEFNLLNGFPEFNIAGASGLVSKSLKHKLKSQVLSSDFKYFPKRKIASFYPSNQSVQQCFADLPIALGYLIQTKQIKFQPSSRDLFIGEIGLNGYPSKAIIDQSLLSKARQLGFKNLFIPKQNLSELISYTGLNIVAYKSLKDLVVKLNKYDYSMEPSQSTKSQSSTFDDIVNNYYPKKVITLGVGMFANVLIIGEPGIGKTLLLNSIRSILPNASNFYKRQIRTDMKNHPFRILNPTITRSELLSCQKDMSVYQRINMGVLGINELNHLSKSVLEVLKSSLEERSVSYKGFDQSSHHSFIATMNPCKCGYSNSNSFKCVCNDYSKKQYIHRLGLPFLDRFDMYLDFNSNTRVKRLESNETSQSDSAQKQVQKLFVYQEKNKFFSDYTVHDFKKLLTEKANLLLGFSSNKLNLSMRRQVKTLRVALAISILKGNDSINSESIYEAITYQKFYYDLLQKKDVG